MVAKTILGKPGPVATATDIITAPTPHRCAISETQLQQSGVHPDLDELDG